MKLVTLCLCVYHIVMLHNCINNLTRGEEEYDGDGDVREIQTWLMVNF